MDRISANVILLKKLLQAELENLCFSGRIINEHLKAGDT